MPGNRPAGVLLILSALLLVAFAAPAGAAAYSGRVVTSHAAAGARASAHLDTPALTRRLEDEVAPEMMTWAASLAGGGEISPLVANKQACLPNGRCTMPGAPYSRPCVTKYLDRECGGGS
jgi:hypothetical protein